MTKTESKVASRKIINQKDEYGELRSKIKIAVKDQNVGKWDIAQLLWRVKEDTTFISWGYRNFMEYSDIELDMDARSARAYIGMYKGLEVDFKKALVGDKVESEKISAMKYHSDVRDRILGLGWTKAKLLLPLVAADPMKVEQEIAGAKDKTTRALQKYVSDEQLRAKGKDPDEKIFGMTFALYEDQKSSVATALELAERAAGSSKKGHLISLIAQDYVASNMANETTDKGLKMKHLNKYGAMLGVDLIVVDPSTHTVISGSKTLKKIQLTAK